MWTHNVLLVLEPLQRPDALLIQKSCDGFHGFRIKTAVFKVFFFLLSGGEDGIHLGKQDFLEHPVGIAHIFTELFPVSGFNVIHFVLATDFHGHLFGEVFIDAGGQSVIQGS
jgi:hypothetical protein